ncbi:hypothetical protein [Caballeronia telluris]|uniref:hypothetical protein n=1 Tax=Caballeronia telluris TaxID=326475 RepID=UPI000F73A8EC|nr:hypothetical protein [Caballeronia telluris]
MVDTTGQTLTVPDGSPLVRTASLKKGQATFLDLENPLGAGVATAYRPLVKITPQILADEIASASIIVANELYDSAPGKSSLAAPSDPCVGALCLTVKGVRATRRQQSRVQVIEGPKHRVASERLRRPGNGPKSEVPSDD